jgi:hypothetical protein
MADLAVLSGVTAVVVEGVKRGLKLSGLAVLALAALVGVAISLLGFFGGVSVGAPASGWPQAVARGILGGLASVGVHQVVKQAEQAAEGQGI